MRAVLSCCGLLTILVCPSFAQAESTWLVRYYGHADSSIVPCCVDVLPIPLQVQFGMLNMYEGAEPMGIIWDLGEVAGDDIDRVFTIDASTPVFAADVEDMTPWDAFTTYWTNGRPDPDNKSCLIPGGDCLFEPDHWDGFIAPPALNVPVLNGVDFAGYLIDRMEVVPRTYDMRTFGVNEVSQRAHADIEYTLFGRLVAVPEPGAAHLVWLLVALLHYHTPYLRRK